MMHEHWHCLCCCHRVTNWWHTFITACWAHLLTPVEAKTESTVLINARQTHSKIHCEGSTGASEISESAPAELSEWSSGSSAIHSKWYLEKLWRTFQMGAIILWTETLRLNLCIAWPKGKLAPGLSQANLPFWNNHVERHVLRSRNRC